MTKLNYYYGDEVEQFNFFRIPKILFTDERFFKISVEAKVLYGLLHDRMSISVKNGWIDEKGRVYIYFKIETAMELLNIAKGTAIKLFAELDLESGCGLIKKVKQGQGKPSIIYVMNFNSKSESFQTSEKQTSRLPDSAEVLTFENQKSRVLKNESLEVQKLDSNNTKYNNTDINDTEYIQSYPILSYHDKYDKQKSEISYRELDEYWERILENLDYDQLLEDGYDVDLADAVHDCVLDMTYNENYRLFINGRKIPHQAIIGRLLKLRYKHYKIILDALKDKVDDIIWMEYSIATELYMLPELEENNLVPD